jgi:hypothetical protein
LPVVAAATVIGAAAAPACVPVFVTPPLLDVQVAVYVLIALPPSLDGAVNVTVNDPVAAVDEPDTAFAPVGAPGGFARITAFDAAEAVPVPIAFVAVTEHVYVFPLVRLDTTIGLPAALPLRVGPPFVDVHVAV